MPDQSYRHRDEAEAQEVPKRGDLWKQERHMSDEDSPWFVVSQDPVQGVFRVHWKGDATDHPASTTCWFSDANQFCGNVLDEIKTPAWVTAVLPPSPPSQPSPLHRTSWQDPLSASYHMLVEATPDHHTLIMQVSVQGGYVYMVQEWVGGQWTCPVIVGAPPYLELLEARSKHERVPGWEFSHGEGGDVVRARPSRD